ncbi:MAG: DUF493 domain-containing protein [Chitinispirillaceae bacterium]|jgi:putative lipoic acid-binding regulatory protein|nr:DUF493 domain-containing protein [Chitinispirillaceae bacterium]
MPDKKELPQFPCSFPIKAMGKNSDEFCSLVTACVKKHLIDQNDITIATKTSNGDTYISVTATITAQSRQQLDAIYQELKDTNQTLMLL